ncbi:hypothetical protein [Streptomyces sp. NPDC056323]|uniref:hypothetical protein n=1 Tax=Streptomyces sp. NPDC056323 TaxID=3345784 RepID=UPI0035DEB171
MALNATALITTAAATEYDHYVKAREELRGPAADAAQGSGLGPDADDPDRPGVGIGAVVAVLAPMFAGTVALIFLLVGYILKMLRRPPSFADTMLTIGWVSGAAAGAAVLVAAVALLLTALRNGSTSLSAEETEDELPDDVARAKEAWRLALLERGILPFLRDALADPTAGPASRTPRPSANRIPKIGYSRPDFSGPGEGLAAGPRPSFTSPDFAGPAESTPSTGPEHSD